MDAFVIDVQMTNLKADLSLWLRERKRALKRLTQKK